MCDITESVKLLTVVIPYTLNIQIYSNKKIIILYQYYR